MNIPVTPEVLNRLQQLLQEKKFSEERYYPGAPNEEIRLRCERRVNDFLREIVGLLRQGVEREVIFVRARALAQSFVHEDSEEREKVDDYIGEAMRIIGLEDWTEHV